MEARRITLRFLAAAMLAVPGAAEKITFEELGQAYLESHCPQADGAAMCELDIVVAASYASARLGAFELSMPIAILGDRKRGMEVKELARGLVDLQRVWVERYCSDDDARSELLSDLETIGGWIDGWEKGDVSALAKGEGCNLYEALGADPALVEASDRLAAGMMSSAQVGIAPKHTKVLRILACPTRRDFMEAVGYAGLLQPERRKELWHDGVDQWTQFWIDRTLVAALEYAPWSQDPQYQTGNAMDAHDEDGLLQQVVLQAAQALVFTCMNRGDLPLLEKGLALELAIAVCGRANTIDGEGAITTSGATTSPYSRFVPGGNPAGGNLPPAPAAPLNAMLENHWRKGNGEDHFVAPLRKGQKDGSKRAAKDKDNPLRKDKTAHFQLEASGKKYVVTAPFLGALASQQQYPPPEFLNDYREFFRSYQSCFLYWLAENGSTESADASAKLFRELLVRMGSSESLVLDDVVEEVYGVPLSSQDPADESLEWRFLAWLEAGKG
jgi:hypothetical protein